MRPGSPGDSPGNEPTTMLDKGSLYLMTFVPRSFARVALPGLGGGDDFTGTHAFSGFWNALVVGGEARMQVGGGCGRDAPIACLDLH